MPDHEYALAAEISALARSRPCSIGVAESLTGGMIAQPLAAAEAAGEWFRGSLVAYSAQVKHEVLGVPDGPVVSAEAAAAMARGARSLLRADLAVAVTGAGGPSGQDDQPPGTVFLAVCDDSGTQTLHRCFAGEPAAVCAAGARFALELLVSRLRDGREDRKPGTDPHDAADDDAAPRDAAVGGRAAAEP
ncbi:MAG: CinA family protein [Pseudonocardia sp.]|nr:CinA family protein [Pseudonocardia sp.]